MSNTADARHRSLDTHVFFALCVTLALFSLIGHFIADAACQSPEFTSTRQCGSGASRVVDKGEGLATSSLHSGAMLPTITFLSLFLTLTFALAETASASNARSFPPPVRPPIASF